MELIDLTTWDRALHYQIFRNSAQPQYCVSFELDITNFLTAIREKGYSFTFSFVYAVADCANRIKEFRCRFVGGQPVVFDRIHTSFTYLNPDTELFKVVNVGMKDTLEEYVALAKRTEQNQKDYFTGPWGMISSSSPHFHGYPLPTFPTPIPAAGTMPHRCSTGEGISNGTEGHCFLSRYRCTTPLWMAFTSESWQSFCRTTWTVFVPRLCNTDALAAHLP